MSKEFEKKGKDIIKEYNLLNKVFIGKKGGEADCFIVKSEADLLEYIKTRINGFLDAGMVEKFEDDLIEKEKKNIADLGIVSQSLEVCKQKNFKGSEFKAIDSIISFVEEEIEKRKNNMNMYVECNKALEAAKKFKHNNNLYLGVAALFTWTMPEMYDVVEKSKD